MGCSALFPFLALLAAGGFLPSSAAGVLSSLPHLSLVSSKGAVSPAQCLKRSMCFINMLRMTERTAVLCSLCLCGPCGGLNEVIRQSADLLYIS